MLSLVVMFVFLSVSLGFAIDEIKVKLLTKKTKKNTHAL